MSASAQDRFVEATRQHGQGIIEGDAPMTNKAHQMVMIAAKEIRATADRGEAFFVSLLPNEDPSVVKWAAAYLLKSRQSEAEAALERVSGTAPPLIAFGAEMTLKEWRAGRLNMD
jgi:hypothetical protein